MRHAINSVTNSVFNSWSYRARSCLVYYPLRSTCTYYHIPFTCGPFVNAEAEKAVDRRHKTEVKTRERGEHWWQRVGTYGAVSLTLEPSLFNQFGLSLLLAVITLSRSLFIAQFSSSLSSLPFRPLPLSRRYFRDDELQYAPIVAAGNQRAYPKSSMVSTHPTQPKPGLAQPGTSEHTEVYTRIDVDTYTRAHVVNVHSRARERAPIRSSEIIIEEWKWKKTKK